MPLKHPMLTAAIAFALVSPSAVLASHASAPTGMLTTLDTAQTPGTWWMPGDLAAPTGATPSPASAGAPSGCSTPGSDDRCEQWVTTVAHAIAGVEFGGNGAWAATMSPDGAVEYVTGKAAQTTGDMFTAAIDVETGVTLWQTVFDASPLGDFGSKIVVSPDGLTVAVLGTSIKSGPQVLGSINTVAYEAATGRLLWSALYSNNFGPPEGTPTVPAPVGCCWFTADGAATFTADGSSVVITGNITSPRGDSDGVVVAYDAADGDVRWTRIAGGAGYQTLTGVVAAGADAYTIGLQQRPGTFNYDVVATRLDGDSGSVLWTSAVQGGSGAYPRALTIDPAGDRLFAAVAAAPLTGQGVVFVTIAFDTATGDNLWLARHEGAYDAGVDIPTGIVVGPEVMLGDGVLRSRVYVTGMVSNEQINGYDYGTIAYDADTGEELFDARYGTERDERPWAIALSGDGSRVFATGRNAPPYLGGSSGGTAVEPMTIGYDAGTGAQLWVARFSTAAGEGGDPIGVNSSADGSRVVTAGTVVYAAGDTPNVHSGDFLVLGYQD